jgi:outer membrane protein OmpU
MKTIMKTLFVALTSFALLSSANAGELSVTGSAKATWTNVSDTQSGKQIGIANELLFSASGELDNGYTWTYSVALDPTTAGNTDTPASTSVAPQGSAINDDQSLNIGMPGLGTLGINVSAGGFNAKYGWSADAYTVMSDTGKSEGITYSSDLGGTSNIQFATESGLLPLGIVLQAGYGYAKDDGDSTNASGHAGADTKTAYGVTVKPIDGLTLGATYTTIGVYGDGTKHGQDEETGAYYAKYSAGPVTVGYGRSLNAPTLANGTSATTIGTSSTGSSIVEYYENTGFSIGYALNDAVRVSYTDEKAERKMITSSTTTFDVNLASYQIAYNIGGATVSLVRQDVENAAYTNNNDWTETLIGIAMAF